MKNTTYVIMVLAVAVAIVGCEEDNPVVPPRPPWTLVRIFAEDTLRYVPGDSVATPVTIIVANYDGNVLPGRIVSYGLDNSSLGFLEPINPAQGDTTDELGRLQLLFTSAGEPGMVRIFAACDGVSAVDSIVIEEVSTIIARCTVFVTHHVIQVPPSPTDSTEIRICLSDHAGQAVPGVPMRVWTAHQILVPFRVTGPDGCMALYWNPLPPDTCLYWDCAAEVESLCVSQL